MNKKKQRLETAEIKLDNWEDNLIPFKPRARFGSGHFAFAVVLMFTFFTFPSTVSADTTENTSPSSISIPKPGNQPTSQIQEPSTKTIDESLEGINKLLTNLKGDIQRDIEQIEEKQTSWLTPQVLVPLTVGALGTISGFIIALITAFSNLSIKREEHVFNSLQWLSGGTQERSIGIAVIDANWKKFPHLHETWTSVLVAQAVYLLAEQQREETKQRQHEITNANNILRILEKTRKETELLDDKHVKELERALAARVEEEKATKGNSKHGLDLPGEVVKQWQNLLTMQIQAREVARSHSHLFFASLPLDGSNNTHQISPLL